MTGQSGEALKGVVVLWVNTLCSDAQLVPAALAAVAQHHVDGGVKQLVVGGRLSGTLGEGGVGGCWGLGADSPVGPLLHC